MAMKPKSPAVGLETPGQEVSRLPRRSFAGHPEFTLLLQQISREIAPHPGSSLVSATFVAQGTRHAFTLLPENFEVARTRRPTVALGCVVCQVRTARQYGFFVRGEDGEVRGPIGSSCLFRHVLGLERARAYGARLNTLLRTFDEPGPDLGIQEDEWLDYVAYLRRLCLPYLLDEQLRREARLTIREVLDFQRAMDAGQPLPPTLYRALLVKGERMAARLGTRLLEQESPWALHAGRTLHFAETDESPGNGALPPALEQGLNFHVLELSTTATWMVAENGHASIEMTFRRGESPFHHPHAARIDHQGAATAFASFLVDIEQKAGHLRKKSGPQNTFFPLGGHALGSLRFQAYFVPRAWFPVQGDALWAGRAVVLDISDVSRPRRQTLRLYQTRDGGFPARYVTTSLGSWLMTQGTLLGS